MIRSAMGHKTKHFRLLNSFIQRKRVSTMKMELLNLYGRRLVYWRDYKMTRNIAFVMPQQLFSKVQELQKTHITLSTKNTSRFNLESHPRIMKPLTIFLLCSFFFFFNSFIYFWLCWVFVSVLGLSLAVASGGHSSSRCAGLSLSWPLLLWNTGSRRTGSVVVVHGPSCSAACGILPDQGSNPCPLHWQADAQPLRHQGSPSVPFKIEMFEEIQIICMFLGSLIIVSYQIQQ